MGSGVLSEQADCPKGLTSSNCGMQTGFVKFFVNPETRVLTEMCAVFTEKAKRGFKCIMRSVIGKLQITHQIIFRTECILKKRMSE